MEFVGALTYFVRCFRGVGIPNGIDGLNYGPIERQQISVSVNEGIVVRETQGGRRCRSGERIFAFAGKIGRQDYFLAEIIPQGEQALVG